MSKPNIQKNLQKLIEEADDIFDDWPKRKESKQLYKKALEIAKKTKKKLEAEYIQGKIDVVDGKWIDAIRRFDETIDLAPNFYKGWTCKGFALGELGRYEEAIEYYDKALKIDPEYISALGGKGTTLHRLGRYEEAIEYYDKALKIDPEHLLALANKGATLHNLRRYEEALEYYDKALKIDPKYMLALANKGATLHNLRRYEEALEYYDKALKIDPEYMLALVNKGVVLSELGSYAEALEYYDKALKIDPTFSKARDNRNLVLTLLGKEDEAQRGREDLYSEKKKEIEQSEIPPEEKDEKILEIDAKKEVINELKGEYKTILDAKKTYEDRLAVSLKPRDKPLKENFFLVLRRWNSYTPLMLTATESNLGGGYFLYWKGKGIVIDPGFDFLDNLLNSELSIHDIDAVIITHAHVDHCSDFESLLTLLFEYNDKNKGKKKIDLFMNLGVMKKFLGWIPVDVDEKRTIINRIYSLEKGISHDLEAYNLRLTATNAIHDEILCKSYSVGLLFELYNEGKYTKTKPFKIGYTSDTKHDEDVEEQYKGVDIIVPHLGSIDDNDFKLEEENRHENHLMLKGVISTIQKSKAKLAIVSEFGEELREHRVTIVGALNRVFQQNKMAKCLTGDIGLKVSIPNLKMKCHYCHEYSSLNNVLEHIDPNNKEKKSIIYYCKKCENTYEYETRKRDS